MTAIDLRCCAECAAGDHSGHRAGLGGICVACPDPILAGRTTDAPRTPLPLTLAPRTEPHNRSVKPS